MKHRRGHGLSVLIATLLTPAVILTLALPTMAVSWAKPFTGGTSISGAIVAASTGSGTNVVLVTPTFTLSSDNGYGETLSVAGPTGGGDYSYNPVTVGLQLPAWTCPSPCGITRAATNFTVFWNATLETRCVGAGVLTVASDIQMRAYLKVLDATTGVATIQSAGITTATLATCNVTNTYSNPGGGSIPVVQISYTGVALHTYILSAYVSFYTSSVMTCPTGGCGTGSEVWASVFVSSLYVGTVLFT